MRKQVTFLVSILENKEIAQMLRSLQIHFDPEKCKGVYQCYAA